VIYNILIDAMCKSGKLEDARELFLKLHVKGLLPDVRSWTSIISGLCREGLLDEAYKAFRQMERDGCPPDCCSYNVIVRGFLQSNSASRAEQLFQEMFDRGFSADALTRTLAADLLSKDDNLGLKRLLGESECCQGEKVM
jgi:pentatricopeptide repeat protein